MANTTTTTLIKTSSDGAWQGNNPLNYAFPLLILQTILVIIISRLLAFLLKPLHQPKVIAEILGGILLGPSALGRNEDFLRYVFPSWSIPILESVASIGLLFFLFLVGLELDLSSIRRSGWRALSIALAGISLPFALGVGLTFLLRRLVKAEEKVGYAQCLIFMGVALSITAFPVLARILAELKLLTTQIGETAMAAAAFNDVAAWILLALAEALAGGGGASGNHSPLVSVWVLASGFVFVGFMLVVVRPAMSWVGNRYRGQADDNFVDEAYICLTLAGVMAAGFMTDLIGIHAIFGAFVFGLTIPKGGEFEERLIKRLEDFVSGLLLPLYFASSGLKTDVTKIRGAEAWALLLLVISMTCAGKILGTFVVAMICMIPARESFTLGVLMNTKGLVELIVLNIGKEKKVLNDEMFAILVLMALVTTFMTTPTVMAIYKPSSSDVMSSESSSNNNNCKSSKENKKKQSTRILACIHGPSSLPSLVNLIDSLRSSATHNSPLKLYVMDLIELTDRSSSIRMVQRARKNGFPFVNRFRSRGAGSGSCSRGLVLHDQVAAAFQAYLRVNGAHVTVRHSTVISALSTMHEDIIHVAKAKRVSMILLPFHKQFFWRSTEGGESESASMVVLGHGWRGVNQRVLKTSPCSVAVFVDRGFGFGSGQLDTEPGNTGAITITRKVCVVFVGGADDREALQLGQRMAQHPQLMVTVLRLLLQTPPQTVAQRYCCSISAMNEAMDKELDEIAMAEFKESAVECIEKAVDPDNIADEVVSIGQNNLYELVIVGKGRFPSTMSMTWQLVGHQIEQPELGPIGDILASSHPAGISSSVLVIQRHQLLDTKNYSTVPLVLPNNDEIVSVRDEDLSAV